METVDHKTLLEDRLAEIETTLILESEMSLGIQRYEELVWERDQLEDELYGK